MAWDGEAEDHAPRRLRIVHIAAVGARDAGAEVTVIDLKDFPLPLFDQDLEATDGLPANGQKLKKLFI